MSSYYFFILFLQVLETKSGYYIICTCALVQFVQKCPAPPYHKGCINLKNCKYMVDVNKTENSTKQLHQVC